MSYTPFLEDMPLAYAYEKKEYYRNSAREEKWGEPVYFFPPSYSLGQLGCGGAYYVYGKPSVTGQGKYGNCTWYVGGRVLETTGHLLTEVIGDAWKTFDKYTGRKDGGNLDNEYLGATIQDGDCIVFVDNKNKTGDGHIVFVEKVQGNTLFISESGYSTQTCYKDKLCVTYILNKSNIISGKNISLRPQKAYKEMVYGVIHTGDYVTKDINLCDRLEESINIIKEVICSLKTL